ncbi:MAG: NBR1-Ig-like domain-containing protein [Planctomycetota bacterium]
MPWMEQQRINLFAGLNELRSEGYDVPKVAPFLDPMITWGTTPVLDVATKAGKQEFVDQYIRFYNQYYSVNQDPYADNYVAQIDGRVVLDTWHVHLSLLNYNSLTRTDVESRLSGEFGGEHPIFNDGIYMVGTGTNVFSFTDQIEAQFLQHAYYVPLTVNNIKTVQVKGGYWDQNIRNPGFLLSRDGGLNYIDAWNDVLADPTVDRVYIESWNEYDEGSGIYACDTINSPYIKPGSGNTGTDTWSNTNDPFEYIKTTAEGARQFNDTPDYGANILWHNMPAEMTPGEKCIVQVVVRNEGDLSWTGAEDFMFGQKDYLGGEVLFGTARYLIDDMDNEIPLYGGIFRGRPIIFEFELEAPSSAGEYLTHWGMLQEDFAWFGEELVVSITVVPEPATWAMILSGLFVTGGAAFARKRVARSG